MSGPQPSHSADMPLAHVFAWARSRVCAWILVALAFLSVTVAEHSHAKAPSPAPLIVIDAGHGGRYSNANANGLREKKVNLAIAKELRKALVARGYKVKMTRTTDRVVVSADIRTWNWSAKKGRWYFAHDGRRGAYKGVPRDDLQGRVNIANKAGADLFISIHANGSRSKKTRGTETWVSRKDKLGMSLDGYVQRAVLKQTKLRNRGTRTADFYVCRWSNMPGILVETAFISNKSDARLLKKARFRKRIATGIAQGVDAWMNTKPYKKRYARLTASSAQSVAIAASKAWRPAGAGGSVVVVRSDKAADAPGAAGLATRLNAPLLLANSNGRPSAAAAAELARVAPSRVVLAGVAGSFDANAVASFASASSLPTSAVDVLTGANRPALAASIVASMGPVANGDVMVASATDVYSTLPAAGVSASHGMPLLLVSGGRLDATSKAWLAANRGVIRRMVLVGAPAKVPASVAAGFSAVRIDGATYTQRVARLNDRYFTSTRTGSLRPVVAQVSKNAEYLVAASRAGRAHQPLIPVSGRVLPAFTREWITNRRSAIGSFEIVTCGSIPYLMDHMLAKADSW